MTILFVCVGNVSRSQMAAAFFDTFTGGKHEVLSTGTHTAQEAGRTLEKNEYCVQCMQEEGIDMAGSIVTQLTPELAKRADLVVSLIGRNPLPDVIDQSRIVIWDIPDPVGMNMDGCRNVRDAIKILVKDLAEELEGYRSR